MPRPRNPFPAPRCHKGRAVVDLYDGGTRRTVTLGAWGSPEAEREFARLMAERPAGPAAPRRGAGVTLNEVLLAFMRWADGHYRGSDGVPTSEVREYRHSLRPARELYGHLPAAEFGPKALAAVRQRMIAAGWCRTLINRRVDRVKRVFKWAAAEEMVPPAVYDALRAVAGLRKGRTEAKESEPVTPVDPAHVEATLPYLDAHVRCMVELQRLTGMRPGEVCNLTLAEVDRAGPVWAYRPGRHKTAYRGRPRVILIGPKAQAALAAFVAWREVPADVPLFSPRRAREERFADLRACRKTPVQPSQASRRKANPKRVPGVKYTDTAYVHAVGRACEKAGVPHWHPNRLRHLFATEVRKVHGLEAAQVLLGHSRADVTQVYAERDLALATKVATEVG